jgi:membrane associated rhomboid family serine protease
LKKSHRNLETSLTVVIVLWLVLLADLLLPIDLRQYGIRPREIDGLAGILFAPFLHANLAHLAANSGALFVLMLVSLSYNRRLTFRAAAVIILLGGFLVWVFGRPHTIHIGASGLIFGLIGFFLFLGFFRREWSALVVSIIVFFLYGGALLSLLVYVPGVSWSGHVFGFVSGVAAAWFARSGKV